MVKLATEKMARAIAKAREVKPLVRVIEFRTYSVTNKLTGATYTVRFSKQGADKFADCTCKAGERGTVCYHLAAAIGAHMQIAAERAALNF